MAGNTLITRLKADTSQFDSKVKGAKSTLEQFGVKGKEAGQMIGQLDKVLGTNIGTLGKLSVATAAVSTALKVMKDAVFASESNIDEWGRTMESAKGAYDTFLNALNSGNWEGFFSRLNDAIGGARELYDMFDKLGSTKLNNSVPIAILENKLRELRLLKQQGQDVGDQINTISTQLAKLKGQEVTAGENANRQGWINTIKDAGGDETYAKVFFDRYKKEGQAFYDWAAKEQKKYEGLVKGDVTNHYQSYRKENTLTGEARKRYQTLKAIVQKETSLQEYQTGYAQAIQQESAINAGQYTYNRWGGSGGSGGGGKKGGGKSNAPIPAGTIKIKDFVAYDFKDLSSLEGMKNELKAWQKVYEEAGTDAGRKFYKNVVDGLKENISMMEGKEDLFKDLIPDLGKVLPKFKPIAQEGKNIAQAWSNAASMIGMVGTALSSIENPTAKVAGIIAETIATIASAYAQNLAADKTSRGNIYAFIAAAGASVISMATTIAAVKSNTRYANGGEIKGNSFSGDNLALPSAYVNAGEYVFNRAQLGNLAGQLQNGGVNNLRLEARVSAEQIRFVLNNRGKRTGKGESLTWN